MLGSLQCHAPHSELCQKLTQAYIKHDAYAMPNKPLG